jgi:hypothetical protein
MHRNRFLNGWHADASWVRGRSISDKNIIRPSKQVEAVAFRFLALFRRKPLIEGQMTAVQYASHMAATVKSDEEWLARQK